jgi:hypothetical protein
MAESKSKTTSEKQATPTLEVDPLDHEAVQQAGFCGRVPDPTPNAHYTVAGNDLPTPETDAGWAKQAQARRAELASS